MIKYALVCTRGHEFDSWFADSAAFDKQSKKKLVACPICDSTKVEKAIMAPQIGKKGRAAAQEPAAPASTEVSTGPSTPLMMAQEAELRAKIKELRDHVTKNADDVGEKFPDEARKMHYGEIDHRPIYGQAKPEEAKELIEEGVQILPLPSLPDERN